MLAAQDGAAGGARMAAKAARSRGGPGLNRARTPRESWARTPRELAEDRWRRGLVVPMADCSAGPGWAPRGPRPGRRRAEGGWVGPWGSTQLDRIVFFWKLFSRAK
jgi:hypothetical protein